MKIKASDFISELTSDSSSNKSYFIFFPRKPLVVLKELSKISDNNITSFIREEWLNANYFDKDLSLSQNIKFHCQISGKNQDEFLKNNFLYYEFENHNYNGFKKIPKIIWEKFEILLFLEINKVCLIEKPNFFKLISSFSDSQIKHVNESLKSKNIFFFSNNFNITKIKEYFNLFLLIDDKAYKIFDRPGLFMREARQIEEK